MKTMKVTPKKEIEAIIYNGYNADEIREFCGKENVDNLYEFFSIFNGSDGWIDVEVGNIIMKGFDEVSFKVLDRETFDKYFKVAEENVIEIHRKKDCAGKDEIYDFMYYCPKCKNIIINGSSFCSDCGSEIIWRK